MVAPPPHHTVCPTLLSGMRPPWDRGTTLLDDVIGLPVELGEGVPASGRGLHRVAIPAEELGQCAHDARFIVNQQNHDRGVQGHHRHLVTDAVRFTEKYAGAWARLPESRGLTHCAPKRVMAQAPPSSRALRMPPADPVLWTSDNGHYGNQTGVFSRLLWPWCLLPALAQTRPDAWRTSRVDTPAPPLYTRPHPLCDRRSSAQP